MAASTILLDSDGSTPFVSLNFGTILAGTQNSPKLLFANANGDADSNQVNFGVEAVSGNDGYLFTQVCTANVIDASGITITGVVSTGGSIANGAIIEYEISVKDQWGHETAPCPVTYQPSINANSSKVTLSWSAVTGAFSYVIYSKVGSGAFKKLAETAVPSYVDLSGTNTGLTDPQVTGSAYAEGTWSPGPLDLGTVAVGAKIPVMLRENIPAGTAATGNPRNHKIFVSHIVI